MTDYVRSAVCTLIGLSILAGSSWTLGSFALSRLRWPELRWYERAALTLTAGLGLTALVLSVGGLFGQLPVASVIVEVLAAVGAALAVRTARRDVAASVGAFEDATAPTWIRTIQFMLIAAVLIGALGSIAPVTEDDSLGYVLPIAKHIAESGAVRVWSDQSHSMWPLSQEVLLAFLIRMGSEQLGTLTAFEWLLVAGVMSALARRLCERAAHVPLAIAIVLGSPVGAFQVASAKEDLLLLAATCACVFAISAPSRTRADLAAAGLFAGIAAGAKYPGAGVVVAVLLWTLLTAAPRRWTSTMIVGAGAVLGGGLWYSLNLWHYHNPVAPFLFGAAGTPVTADFSDSTLDIFGMKRDPITFLLAPVWIFTSSRFFGASGNLFNPVAYLGLAGLRTAESRARHGAAFFVAGVFYVVWFLGLQNSRLLLPAIALLAPSAADQVARLVRHRPFLQVPACGVAALCLGFVVAVGGERARQFVGNPGEFLLRNTQYYDAIDWIDRHLDPRRHRVAAGVKQISYLDISVMPLSPAYEFALTREELRDPARLIVALRREHITHVIAAPGRYPDLGPYLRVVYENDNSRLGGRLFREPRTGPIAVFEIIEKSDPPLPKFLPR